MDTIQNFYGRAIRDNKGNAKEMAKATHAILKHYSSTLEEPKHNDCPSGPTSWCSFQRDRANGTNCHKPIKNPLPDAVVEVLQPLFNRLGDETFLVGCENCYTQNRNECLHHVIWGMAAKEMFSSPREVSLAICLGVLQFNQGFSATYTDLLPALGIQIQPKMLEAWKNIDIDRIYQSDYRNTPEVKLRRKKKRKEKHKRQDAFVHEEGIMYKSQSFHGGAKRKKTSGTTKKVSKTKKARKTTKRTAVGKKARETTKKASQKKTPMESIQKASKRTRARNLFGSGTECEKNKLPKRKKSNT